MGLRSSRLEKRSQAKGDSTDLGHEYSPTYAYGPYLRGDTLVINDEFVTRWIFKFPYIREVFLPLRPVVPIRNIVVDAEKSLVSEIDRLNLRRNPVTTIRGEINLEGITAKGIRFLDVPSWIKEQTNLKYLSLSNNRISELPAWLHNLPKLRSLDLDGNKLLQTIPSPNSNLEILNVSGCDIRSLPRDLFHHALKRVDVSNNKGEKEWVEKVIMVKSQFGKNEMKITQN